MANNSRGIITGTVHSDIGVGSTTNKIEGEVNTQLRAMLRHRRRGCPRLMRNERSNGGFIPIVRIRPPYTLIRPEHHSPHPEHKKVMEEQFGPGLLGIALSEASGLWVRKGWAARPAKTGLTWWSPG